MPVGQAINRLMVWRRIMDNASIEHATAESTAEGIRISGTVLAADKGRPLRVDYRLLLDSNWQSRSLHVVQNFDGKRRLLKLIAGDGVGWSVNGQGWRDLDGCIDIDISVSPSTNALPINRLAIPQGGTAETLAAWVRFPQLTVERARQQYERLAPAIYRYASLASGFTATIQVDDLGFPIEYEGVWTRIAAGRASPQHNL